MQKFIWLSLLDHSDQLQSKQIGISASKWKWNATSQTCIFILFTKALHCSPVGNLIISATHTADCFKTSFYHPVVWQVAAVQCNNSERYGITPHTARGEWRLKQRLNKTRVMFSLALTWERELDWGGTVQKNTTTKIKHNWEREVGSSAALQCLKIRRQKNHWKLLHDGIRRGDAGGGGGGGHQSQFEVTEGLAWVGLGRVRSSVAVAVAVSEPIDWVPRERNLSNLPLLISTGLTNASETCTAWGFSLWTPLPFLCSGSSDSSYWLKNLRFARIKAYENEICSLLTCLFSWRGCDGFAVSSSSTDVSLCQSNLLWFWPTLISTDKMFHFPEWTTPSTKCYW